MSWFNRKEEEYKDWEALKIAAIIGAAVLAVYVLFTSTTVKAVISGAILGGLEGCGYQLGLESTINTYRRS